VGASSCENLPPAIGRDVLSRAVLMRACAGWLGPLIDLVAAGRVAARDAVSGLGIAAACAAQAGDDAEAVDRATKAWASRLDEALRATSDAYEARVLSGLRVSIEEAHMGDPFAELFETVTERAAYLYEGCWPEVSFSVTHRAGPPRDGKDAYGVVALVMPAGHDRPAAQVRLGLHPASLGPATYAALPAVLTHECVCHVAARQRGEIDNESWFAEGFMDWASSYYLAAWAAAFGPLGTIAEEHAGPLFDAIANGAPGLAVARRRGRRAAQHVARSLERHHGWLRGESDAAVARLAVAMNLVDVSLARKDAYVGRINIAADEPLDGPLVEALRGGRSADDLL
jgi:hypothetical protein